MTERPPQTPTIIEDKEKLSRRILVAEDEPSLQIIYRKMLERMGYVVEVVGDGQALLSKLATEKYDLVITDNNMPNMTGLEALGKIREDQNLADLPVIVCSADYHLEKKFKNLGAVLVQKPFEVSEIKEIIEKILQ